MAKKKNNFLFIIIIAVILVVVFAKDLIIKAGVETTVRAVTGLPLKIDNLHVGLTSSLIDIKGLKLYNPAGFEEKTMVDIPQIYVDYKLSSILKGKIEINDLKVHLKEFIVVKNKEGEVNLDHLKMIQEQAGKRQGAEESKPAEPKKQELQVDNLALKVEKVIYKDYSKGGEPSINEFNIGFDQTYTDIKNLNAVISIIIVRTLAQTTIASLTNLDLGGLTSAVSGTLKGATDTTMKMLGETSDTTKKVLGETTETLKNTTENLKGIIKNPFGK